MRLRKCQATYDGEVLFHGLFHCFGTKNGETVAFIEREDGRIERWGLGVKFLEPARQRVEVTMPDNSLKTGYLVGWFPYQDGDEAWPCAMVEHDDGKCHSYCESRIRIIKEVPND